MASEPPPNNPRPPPTGYGYQPPGYGYPPGSGYPPPQRGRSTLAIVVVAVVLGLIILAVIVGAYGLSTGDIRLPGTPTPSAPQESVFLPTLPPVVIPTGFGETPTPSPAATSTPTTSEATAPPVTGATAPRTPPPDPTKASVTLANLTDKAVDVPIYEFDAEGNPLARLGIPMGPWDLGSTGIIPPGVYRLVFKFHDSGNEIGRCDFRLSALDAYDFVILDDSVEIASEKTAPTNDAELNVATSSLCKQKP